MKKYNLLQLVFLFSLLFITACSLKQEHPQINEPLVSVQKDAENLMNESGVRSIMAKKEASWQEFHQNYLETTTREKDNKVLNSYKSSLIRSQILNTSILEEIDSDVSSILELYLKDLKGINYSYPKINYLILNKMRSHLDVEEIKSFAKISYEKGIDEIEKRRSDIALMPESSEFEKEIKMNLLKTYKENFEIYLPKLKEFFMTE